MTIVMINIPFAITLSLLFDFVLFFCSQVLTGQIFLGGASATFGVNAVEVENGSQCLLQTDLYKTSSISCLRGVVR